MRYELQKKLQAESEMCFLSKMMEREVLEITTRKYEDSNTKFLNDISPKVYFANSNNCNIYQ